MATIELPVSNPESETRSSVTPVLKSKEQKGSKKKVEGHWLNQIVYSRDFKKEFALIVLARDQKN